jgi:hypothetical protein
VTNLWENPDVVKLEVVEMAFDFDHNHRVVEVDIHHKHQVVEEDILHIHRVVEVDKVHYTYSDLDSFYCSILKKKKDKNNDAEVNLQII